VADASDFDYGNDAAPDPTILARASVELDQLAIRAERATAVRQRAEEHLAHAKKCEEQITTKLIPELLERMHAPKSVTPSGAEISVKRHYRGTIALRIVSAHLRGWLRTATPM
jgi:hypothetical protein